MEATEAANNGTKSHSKQGDNTAKTPRKQRYLPSLPTASSADERSKVTYQALCDNVPVEWHQLKNNETFSLSSDGSFPLIKVTRNKAVRIADREVFMVGGGRCYRVAISNLPGKNAE